LEVTFGTLKILPKGPEESKRVGSGDFYFYFLKILAGVEGCASAGEVGGNFDKYQFYLFIYLNFLISN
jgi:hypothetical protein